MELDDYLSLLDWTERQIVAGKSGSILSNMEPLLERMELNIENWVDTVEHFEDTFYQGVNHIKEYYFFDSES